MTTFLIKDSSNLREYERGIVSAIDYNPVTFSLFSEDENANSYEISWYEKPYASVQGTCGLAWNTTDTTDLDVDADFAAAISPNYIIQIGSEQVRVKSVDAEANSIEVYERGFGATVAATHDAGDAIYLIGKAEVEGGLTDSYRPAERTERTNFVQEFTENISVSARSAKQSLKDFEDLIQEEEMDKMEEMLRQINRTAIYGQKVKDSVNGAYATAGLLAQISAANGVANSVSAAGNLAEADLETFCQNLAKRGSSVNTFVMSPAVKQQFAGLGGYTPFTNVGQAVTLGNTYEYYMSDALGAQPIKLVADPDMMTSEIIAVDEAHLRYHVLEEKDGTASFLKITEEPTDSSVRQETVRTEIGFVVKNADRAGILAV